MESHSFLGWLVLSVGISFSEDATISQAFLFSICRHVGRQGFPFSKNATILERHNLISCKVGSPLFFLDRPILVGRVRGEQVMSVFFGGRWKGDNFIS